jgi:hypothetical protein
LNYIFIKKYKMCVHHSHTMCVTRIQLMADKVLNIADPFSSYDPLLVEGLDFTMEALADT